MKTVTLESICDFKNGRGFKKSEWCDSGLPIIRIQNLNKYEAPFNYYQGKYDKAIEVNHGDLLFSWSGTIGSSFGAHIWERETGVLNQHIFKIQLSDTVDKHFAYHALQWITAEIEKKVNGAVGLVHITKAKLNKFTIPLPPLPEQKCIVAILDEAFAGIDAAVANTEKNLANTRELFESYLNGVFTQKGDGWVEKPLHEILLVQPRNGWSPPAKNHSDSGVSVLTLSSVTGFHFNGGKRKRTNALTKKDAHYWLNDGELLITRSNTHKLVGHVAICSDLSEPTICCDLIMKMQVDEKQANTKFIYWNLRNPKLRELITSSARGANPTMKKINKGVVQNLPLSLPSVIEQKKIAAQLDSLATELKVVEVNYKKKLDSLAELKQSIRQKAFAGELTTLPEQTLEGVVA